MYSTPRPSSRWSRLTGETQLRVVLFSVMGVWFVLEGRWSLVAAVIGLATSSYYQRLSPALAGLVVGALISSTTLLREAAASRTDHVTVGLNGLLTALFIWASVAFASRIRSRGDRLIDEPTPR